MTRISAKTENPISLSRIRGEAGGLDTTSKISIKEISNFAFAESYNRIDDFGQVMSPFTIGSDFKFSEFEFMDANPGYYFITDGDSDSPTSLNEEGNGFLETDDGNSIVTDNESGDTSIVNSIFINTSTLYNVNLKSILFKIRGSTTEPEGLIFINRGNIFSKNAGSPSITTGVGWLSGSFIRVINEGLIMGAGGDGGEAFNLNSNADGQNGGDAISIFYNISIENDGQIFAGGGGGSGSQLSGGGGGAGSSAGSGGAGETNGQSGGISSGGAGGATILSDSSIAMPGGAPATAGFGGLGQGGSAGILLRKNGFTIDSSSISSISYLNNNLKGAVQ